MLSGGRLGLVKGYYIELSWYLVMCLLILFVGPKLRFSLICCRLILMGYMLPIGLLMVINQPLLPVVNIVSESWIG